MENKKYEIVKKKNNTQKKGQRNMKGFGEIKYK